MEPKFFIAAKAFIEYKGKVLIIQESTKYSDSTQAGKWDVPGGRMTPGEDLHESLLREVREETGLEINLGAPFAVNESRPVVRDEQWQIVRVFFRGSASGDQIKLSPDHQDYKWIDPKDFKDFPVIENLNPVFEEYLN